jgi:hypothetical protein
MSKYDLSEVPIDELMSELLTRKEVKESLYGKMGYIIVGPNERFSIQLEDENMPRTGMGSSAIIIIKGDSK